MVELSMTDLKTKEGYFDKVPVEYDNVEERIFDDLLWELDESKRKHKKLKKKAKSGKKKHAEKNKKLRKKNKKLRKKNKELKKKLTNVKATGKCREMAIITALQSDDVRPAMKKQNVEFIKNMVSEYCGKEGSK